MSGVVLRCPTCGTTQTHRGECDACSDAQVRYFCTNHTPGVWLDEPACKECGARFGDAPRSRPPVTAPARSVPVHKTRRPDATPADADIRPTVRKRRPPPAADPDELAVPPSLRDLLDRLSAEPDRHVDTIEELRRYEPAPDTTPRSSIVSGCLFRLLLLVLVVIALGMAGLFLLFSGALG